MLAEEGLARSLISLVGVMVAFALNAADFDG